MEISRMLLKPSIERLEEEFRELHRELNHSDLSSEALQLKNMIQRKIRQLEMLRVAVSYMNTAPDSEPQNFQASFRRLKLELRFARRKWKRLCSNEVRFQKNHDNYT